LAKLSPINDGEYPWVGKEVITQEGGLQALTLEHVVDVSSVKAGESGPWLDASVVICIPERTDQGPDYQLHVRKI
jgi:hypothetical protein